MDPRTTPSWLREAPFWAVSTLLHLVLFFLLIRIALTVPKTEPPPPPIRVELPTSPPRETSPRRDVVERRRVFRPEVPEKLVVAVDPVEVETSIPKGPEDFDTNVQVTPHSDSVTDLGLGSGGARLYGARGEKGALIKEGGGVASENAVVVALE